MQHTRWRKTAFTDELRLVEDQSVLLSINNSYNLPLRDMSVQGINERLFQHVCPWAENWDDRTSPLTMRTVAGHQPHGSFSLGLEYTLKQKKHNLKM